MKKLPKRCVVDTNVPKTANLAVDPAGIPNELNECVDSCVKVIEHIVKRAQVVLDSSDEIFSEYLNQLSMKGQPGVGDHFIKWLHDNRWKFPDKDRVSITRSGDTYDEFPDHEELAHFDVSDRKFVAVANAHPMKPPILEATDSKWWGWKDALANVGITVNFVCPRYVERKFHEKMGIRSSSMK